MLQQILQNSQCMSKIPIQNRDKFSLYREESRKMMGTCYRAIADKNSKKKPGSSCRGNVITRGIKGTYHALILAIYLSHLPVYVDRQSVSREVKVRLHDLKSLEIILDIAITISSCLILLRLPSGKWHEKINYKPMKYEWSDKINAIKVSTNSKLSEKQPISVSKELGHLCIRFIDEVMFHGTSFNLNSQRDYVMTKTTHTKQGHFSRNIVAKVIKFIVVSHISPLSSSVETSND